MAGSTSDSRNGCGLSCGGGGGMPRNWRGGCTYRAALSAAGCPGSVEPSSRSCDLLADVLGVDLDLVLTLAGHRPGPEAPEPDDQRADIIALLERITLTPDRAAGLLGTLSSWLELDRAAAGLIREEKIDSSPLSRRGARSLPRPWRGSRRDRLVDLGFEHRVNERRFAEVFRQTPPCRRSRRDICRLWMRVRWRGVWSASRSGRTSNRFHNPPTSNSPEVVSDHACDDAPARPPCRWPLRNHGRFAIGVGSRSPWLLSFCSWLA